MKLDKIKIRLNALRVRQRNLRREIDRLRTIIRESGEDPDAPKVDLVPRNKEIYRQWKKGKSFVQVGKEFGKSASRISSICNRIEIILERKTSYYYHKYKDLLKYKIKKG